MNYYIADTHFGHSAILRFDHRPFSTIEEMEEVMVLNWNATVRADDTIHILGDFCWGKASDWLRILRRLNGHKVLIEGNHDLKEYPSELRKIFADINPYKEILDNGYGNDGYKVILSHYPMPFYKRAHNEKYVMLCGHVHNTAENKLLEKWTAELRADTPGTGTAHAVNCGQIYNVGCMMPWMHYTPRTLHEIMRGREAYLNTSSI